MSRIIDPLGEIEARAKELWVNAGSPGDKTWRDFFSQAEADILGEPGAVSTARKERATADDQSLSSDFVTLAKDKNSLLAFLATTLKKLLNDHESLCLGYILANNCLRFPSRDIATLAEIGPVSIENIADLLAYLSGDYETDFLKKENIEDYHFISHTKRSDYWRNKLLHMLKEDQALTYTDRNTINRIIDAIVTAGGGISSPC